MAAPLFWAGFWWFRQSTFDLLWPLHDPLPFLLAALAYPVLEEIVFRGLLQGTLYAQPFWRKRYGPVSRANLLASVAFTGLHFFYHPPLWAGLVFFPSLGFGYFRDKYNSLTPAIVLHVFYNVGFFWLFKP